MSEVATGPVPHPDNVDGPNDPAQPREVDAQRANEADMRHDIAGAEAKKPFSSASAAPPPPVSPSVDEENDHPQHKPGLVSGRRNAGRDSAEGASTLP